MVENPLLLDKLRSNDKMNMEARPGYNWLFARILDDAFNFDNVFAKFNKQTSTMNDNIKSKQ